MPYNQDLAKKIRAELGQLPEVEVKKMFGGVAYLVRGNMACGVHGNDLIIRVGTKKYEEALSQPHTHPFDLTGRPMSGWIVVEPEGYRTHKNFKTWIDAGIDFASTLKPK
jgi:TfoX/Sxy family transcriptional regulator of competence genes